MTVDACAVLGGTFDPVHHGHLRAALEAREKLGLQSLSLMPAGTPPHRGGTHASGRHRLAMLRCAVEQSPGLQVDDREIRRDGPSYMVDTLAEIRHQLGPKPLLLLLGLDAAQSLPGWHRWQDLLQLAHLVVLQRPGYVNARHGLHEDLQARWVEDEGLLWQSCAGKVMPLSVTQLDISSTRIRTMMQQGQSPRYLVPAAVLDYIRQHDLYTSC